MLSVLKNLLYVIKNFKTAMFLNIVGLSIAFAAFILIMMQIHYDYTFDHFHEDVDKIYRVETDYYRGEKNTTFSYPMAELLFKSPLIRNGTKIRGTAQIYFSIEGSPNGGFFEKFTTVDSVFTRVFNFHFIEGASNALDNSNNVIIPLSLSKKMFGAESASGKQIKIGDDSKTIAAVYKDFPANSSVNNDIYTSISEQYRAADEWGSCYYNLYVKIDSPDDLDIIIENYKEDLKKIGQNGHAEFNYYFTPLKELHFTSDIVYDPYPKASRDTLAILFLLGFIIIIIAAANFTNFSIALSPVRIKNVNTRKVLGASVPGLRFSLVMEGVLICLIAFGLSLVIIFFSKSFIQELIDPVINLSDYGWLILITGILAMLTGLISGLYPSWYVTSFAPALVLKGSFGFSQTGKKLRTILISLQYIASFTLIISVAFMYLQNHYMRQLPLGYNKDRLIVTDISSGVNENLNTFSDEIKAFSGIENITYCSQLLSCAEIYGNWGRSYNGQSINFELIWVEPSFLDIMEIPIIEGRDFVPDDRSGKGKLIFNQKAKEAYDLKLNTKVSGMEIVGFMDDINYRSFRATTDAFAFLIPNRDWGTGLSYAYIRVKEGSDMYAAKTHIENTLKKTDPDWIFDVRFFDTVFDQVYKSEKRLTSLITIFSILSILISLIGVFGMVVYETMYRTKEISIRKVLGSTIPEVLQLFNKTYLKILAICFVIACPIVYFMIKTWLQNFVYRTPIHVWVFIISGSLLVLITAVTVTWQSWRAATANPVDGLRNE